MESELMHSIRFSMEMKETDELINIWQENNHDDWTDEAFIVVKDILLQRMGELPEQKEPCCDDSSNNENAGEENDVGDPEALIRKEILLPEDFFTRRHNSLLNIANGANVFGYVILVAAIIRVLINFINSQNYGINKYFSTDLITVLVVVASNLWILVIGLILALVLWGTSMGLKMIVETDLNYREKDLEETHE